MALSAKPTGYTVDSGHAYAPTHLWMCDEGTGTTIADQGTGTTQNMTLQNADMWGTDGTYGAKITCSAATSRYALGASGTLFTNSVCLIVIAESIANANADANEYIMGYADTGSVGDRGGILALNGAQTWQTDQYDDAGNNVQKTHSGTFYDSSWHMLAMKFRNGTTTECCAVSLDGGAWQVDGNDTITALAALDRYGLGIRPTGTPSNGFDGHILAAWVYEDPTYTSLNDAWIAALYANPWQFLTTTSTYVKILAPADAASASSIQGVVLNAARDTVIGEFTGQAFEGALEAGEAVLKINVDDIVPDGSTLTTSDAPLVVAYNATHSTDLAAATVIEE
jgi:hypothetical protein